ncbi:uncharacterized protein LOC128962438 [Oppia nitens]|uniref:uncharacterized protein LOC128962438 n=1 Tax=Oppia nitens TaxID=1686743 RepID=UPI0023D9DA2A|nr:uncharacterized protein LOC128962438 [Oppia nitens]
MKLPRRLQDISYKGTVFSYSSKNQIRPFRDSFMESDSTQQLEDSFTQLLTETIVDRFRSKMKSGIPSMAIPPLDPLRLDRINLEPTIGGDPFNIVLSDLQITGISDFQLRELKPKLNALKFRVALMMPKLTANCQYSANGTVYQVFDVRGEGYGQLEYTDVLLRTQVNLALDNGTFRVTTADPPLVDFHRVKVNLKRLDGQPVPADQSVSEATGAHVAHELGPLLFWMLADHVVEEIDYYVAKYINNALIPFKVPETFKPVVTWLMNRNSMATSRIASLPNILGQWFGAITGMKPQISISTKLVH